MVNVKYHEKNKAEYSGYGELMLEWTAILEWLGKHNSVFCVFFWQIFKHKSWKSHIIIWEGAF